MSKALGRGIRDLSETEVSVSTFTREISKTLGVRLPNDQEFLMASLWVVRLPYQLFCD